MEGFNSAQFEAAQRAWQAGADHQDPDTRKALERLSATYFWASIGMGRAAGLSAALPSVRVFPDCTQSRQTGGCGLRDGIGDLGHG
jgi:hypothetical protein